jgi:periplasmic divalent cation tolerance protein
MAKDEKLIVITSVSSEDIAIQMAQELLETYNAACINILPKVHSIYRWKGRITDDFESILIIKTRSDRFADVKKVIEATSGYELPEILAIPVKKGSKEFLEWIDINLEPAEGAE